MMKAKDAAMAIPKTDRVYSVLRQRIRDLELPPGALLKKDELATELGVSRAPISEAIARLTEEGLVDVFPQHGSFVAAIRASDVREGLFMRTGLEVEAWRQAAATRTPALIAALDDNLAGQRAALAQDDLTRFYELDEQLHEMIFAFIGQGRALKFLDSVRAQLDRVRRLALPAEGRPEATLAEHARLIEAVRIGDPEFAGASMRAHLTAVADTVEGQLEHYAASAG